MTTCSVVKGEVICFRATAKRSTRRKVVLLGYVPEIKVGNEPATKRYDKKCLGLQHSGRALLGLCAGRLYPLTSSSRIAPGASPARPCISGAVTIRGRFGEHGRVKPFV